MKVLRYMLPVVALSCATAVSAVDYKEDRMIDAIQHWVDSKQDVNVRDKSADLSIAGDLRLRYETAEEKRNGTKLTGASAATHTSQVTPSDTVSGLPAPDNMYSIDFNLMMNYSMEHTWANVWMQFHHAMGSTSDSILAGKFARHAEFGNNGFTGLSSDKVGSGSLNGVLLRQAYMGYRLFDEGATVFDIMAGRFVGYNLFTSKVQFGDNYDGLVLKYAVDLDSVGTLGVQAMVAAVNQTDDWYSWVGEVSLNNIADLGLNVRYSIHDYAVKSTMPIASYNGNGDLIGYSELDNDAISGMDFLVSEVGLSYDFDKEVLGWETSVYAAYGINHDATKGVYQNAGADTTVAAQADEATAVAAIMANQTRNDRDDQFWYAGFSFGDVQKPGDFSLGARYDRVEAQSMAPWDVSGMSRGFDVPATNYKGWTVEGAVAITDNMSLSLQYEYTKSADSDITHFRAADADAVVNGGGTWDYDTDYDFRLDGSSTDADGGEHSNSRFVAELVYAF